MMMFRGGRLEVVGWIIGFRNWIRGREPALGWRGTWSVFVPSKCPLWSAVWSTVPQCGPVCPGRGPGSYKAFSQFLQTHGPGFLASLCTPFQSSKGLSIAQAKRSRVKNSSKLRCPLQEKVLRLPAKNPSSDNHWQAQTQENIHPGVYLTTLRSSPDNQDHSAQDSLPFPEKYVLVGGIVGKSVFASRNRFFEEGFFLILRRNFPNMEEDFPNIEEKFS